MKDIILAISIICLIIAIIIGYVYPEHTSNYKQGYNQAVQDIEKQRQIGSLGALYNELWQDDINYIGIWTPSKIELNRRKIDSIFNELCNLKAELK